MKHLMVIIFIGFLSLPVSAQERIRNPFLWKVTKGEQEFYLFGTIHLAEPELQLLPKSLVKVLNTSDRIYIEVPMDRATQRKATQLSLRRDHRSLKEILPSKLYHECDAYVRSLSSRMRLDSFDRMKIWALSSTLSGLKSHLMYPNLRPIDKIIYDYALSHHKKIQGIETIQEQLEIMDDFTLNEQILGLEATMDQLNGGEDLTKKLKAYYLKGKERELLAFMNRSMFQVPKYKKLEKKLLQRVLYDRNVRMAKRIKRVVAKSPKKHYLFAFGVMHFLGMRSVIGYLKVYGYRVERMMLK